MQNNNEGKNIVTTVILVIITAMAIIGFLSSDKTGTEESKEA